MILEKINHILPCFEKRKFHNKIFDFDTKILFYLPEEYSYFF